MFGLACPDDCQFEPGTEVWTTILSNPESRESVESLAVHDSGSVTIGGQSYRPDAMSFLASVSEEGLVFYDEAVDVVTDAPDRVAGVTLVGDRLFAAGLADRPEVLGAPSGIWAAEFGGAAEVLWVSEHLAAAPGNQVRSGGIVLDSDGTLLVLGTEERFGQSHIPGIFLSVGLDGQVLDVREVEAPPTSPDESEGVWFFPLLRQNAGQDVRVAGGISFVSGDGTQGLLRLLGDGGTTLWEVVANSRLDVDGLEGFYDIAVGSNGSVAATGHITVNAEDTKKVWTQMYDPNGNRLWEVIVEPAFPGFPNESHGVAVSSSGDVYVSSAERAEGDIGELVVRRYDAGGDLIWESRWFPEGSYRHVNQPHIALDDEGAVIIAGQLSDPDALPDAFVRKITP